MQNMIVKEPCNALLSHYVSISAAQTPEVTLTSFTYRKTLVTFDENFYHVES